MAADLFALTSSLYHVGGFLASVGFSGHRHPQQGMSVLAGSADRDLIRPLGLCL